MAPSAGSSKLVACSRLRSVHAICLQSGRGAPGVVTARRALRLHTRALGRARAAVRRQAANLHFELCKRRLRLHDVWSCCHLCHAARASACFGGGSAAALRRVGLTRRGGALATGRGRLRLQVGGGAELRAQGERHGGAEREYRVALLPRQCAPRPDVRVEPQRHGAGAACSMGQSQCLHKDTTPHMACAQIAGNGGGGVRAPVFEPQLCVARDDSDCERSLLSASAPCVSHRAVVGPRVCAAASRWTSHATAPARVYLCRTARACRSRYSESSTAKRWQSTQAGASRPGRRRCDDVHDDTHP